MKILLEKSKSVNSVNKDERVAVELNTTQASLREENINDKVDEFEEYIKEKDSSTKYRLSFTISPLCSNVLFNNVSEIIYHEGGDDCIVIPHVENTTSTALTSSALASGSNVTLGGVKTYHKAKYKTSEPKALNTYLMIKDTTYSHKTLGPFVYHCGIDIFNNHILRQKEFTLVEPITNTGDASDSKNFNTIEDVRRNRDGKAITEVSRRSGNKTGTTKSHIYTYDTIKSFFATIKEKLIEDENGWWGFINPCTLSTRNYNTESINKCMNNNKACEQYDLYPDRSLYSFTPKYNQYRDRYEYNWDYCLTYPFGNFYDNDCVCNTNLQINGLKAYLMSELDANYRSDEIVYFRSAIRHNLVKGSQIKLTIINGTEVIKIPNVIRVCSNGAPKGNDLEHYFAVYQEEIQQYKEKITDTTEFRFSRVSNGSVCQYYFRKFRKLPNFKYTNINTEDGVTEEEYGKGNKFNTSLNRMGFATNGYGSDIAQILYDEDVDVQGLRDNMGRPLSEIFLTIVKNNEGHEKWYEKKVRNTSDIKFSHCFGKVSSGLDLLPEEDGYNVHKIHNVDVNSTIGAKMAHLISESPNSLETDITIDNDYFLGDLVEFSPHAVEEVVLEYVYHRFNTAQREYTKDNEYYNIIYDEIAFDDYDVKQNYSFESFSVSHKRFNIASDSADGIYPANINPEGYWYNPHYRILLKKYNTTVQEGQHTRVVFDTTTTGVCDNGAVSGTTFKCYYLETGKELYLFNKATNEKITATIKSVGNNLKDIEILLPSGKSITSLKDWNIYKPNSEMPAMAYDMNDGTGRYLWREQLSTAQLTHGDELYDAIFTNGATYYHKNINFFLRRQDPMGEYGLSYIGKSSAPDHVLKVIPNGSIYDYTNIEYVKSEDNNKC